MKQEEVLIKEYFRVSDNIKSISNIFLQLISVPFLAVYLSFVVFKEVSSLALVFPFFIFYCCYLLEKYTIKIVEYRLYAKYLEEQINKHFKKDVLLEEVFNRSFFYEHQEYLQGAFIIPICLFSVGYFIYEFYNRFQKGDVFLKSLLVFTAFFLSVALLSLFIVIIKLIKTSAIKLSAFKEALHQVPREQKPAGHSR